MPISDFDGSTFVAFLDISGFKELMRNKNKAWKALDRLYQIGYDKLRPQNFTNVPKVEGVFISDSGILFVRSGNSRIEELRSLLNVIKEINKGMIRNDFMLTTSVAYGRFKYQERIEFPGIAKEPVYGNAYVSAFLDNENGLPKIQPGQCRIVIRGLPSEVINSIENGNDFETIRKEGNKHYYYYWMAENSNDIDRFKKEYRDAYNLKYRGMLRAIKRSTNRERDSI